MRSLSSLVLRQEVFGIDHADVELIAEFVLKRPPDDLERSAFVMVLQVLDVLEQKSRRAVRVDDPRDVKEQRALRLVLKAMLPA